MRYLTLLMATLMLTSSCAGQSALQFGNLHSSLYAAQLNAEVDSSTVLEDDEDKTLEKKSGAVLIGALAVGVALGSAILIPLLIKK